MIHNMYCSREIRSTISAIGHLEKCSGLQRMDLEGGSVGPPGYCRTPTPEKQEQ